MALAHIILMAAPGDLDRTFGNDGNVTTGLDMSHCFTLQEDGKIVVAGILNSQVAVLRYEQNGSIDTTFGTNGRVITDIPVGDHDFASDIAVQSDGKIVVGGWSAGNSPAHYAVIRYENNGTLDQTFGGGDGITTTEMGGTTHSMALQKDGKIILAGDADSGSNETFGLVRYTTEGILDTSFGGGDGKVFTDVAQGGAWINSIALQKDGKIVASGTSDDWTSWNMVTIRYTTSGDIDQSFGINGTVQTTFGTDSNRASCIAIQKDGKILVTGEGGGDQSNAVYNSEYATARLDSNGSADLTFGSSGKVVTDITGNGFTDRAERLVLQENGKILVVGDYATTASGQYIRMALLRYESNGTLDTAFGDRGKVSFGDNTAEDMAVQKDGKILVLGGNKVRRFEGDETEKPSLPLSAIYYLLD